MAVLSMCWLRLMEGGRFWVAMGGKWSEQMHGRFAWLWVEDWWKNELNRALLLIMGLFFIFFGRGRVLTRNL